MTGHLSSTCPYWQEELTVTVDYFSVAGVSGITYWEWWERFKDSIRTFTTKFSWQLTLDKKLKVLSNSQAWAKFGGISLDIGLARQALEKSVQNCVRKKYVTVLIARFDRSTSDGSTLWVTNNMCKVSWQHFHNWFTRGLVSVIKSIAAIYLTFVDGSGWL